MGHVLQRLKAEHRAIERVLLALDAAAVQVQRGEPVDPGWLADAAHFLTRYTDGLHQAREEGVIFKVLLDRNVAAMRGPVACMITEHHAGRELVAQMSRLARKAAHGDRPAQRAWARAAVGYAQVLRAHIRKEDDAVFPLAEAALTEAELDLALERWEAFEHPEALDLESAADALVERARAFWPQDASRPT
jgi:branched-chain amino acid transport system ATP-binding protein